jgi:hypothetical protein
VSRKVFKCGACKRRIRHAPFLALRDRQSRSVTRYHGAPYTACLEAGAAQAERRGPDELVLHFVHARGCGDARGKLDCAGGCFVVRESVVTAKTEEG